MCLVSSPPKNNGHFPLFPCFKFHTVLMNVTDIFVPLFCIIISIILYYLCFFLKLHSCCFLHKNASPILQSSCLDSMVLLPTFILLFCHSQCFFTVSSISRHNLIPLPHYLTHTLTSPPPSAKFHFSKSIYCITQYPDYCPCLLMPHSRPTPLFYT